MSTQSTAQFKFIIKREWSEQIKACLIFNYSILFSINCILSILTFC